MKIFRIIVIVLMVVSSVEGNGFLKRNGKNIVDGSGSPIMLRGIGLGGWLVPEGYMIQTTSFANAAWQFKQKIKDLIGEEKTNQFFELYRKNFVTRKDVQQLKQWGFNSIRLPMHYNLMTPIDQPFTYTEEGFAIIDSLLSWCKESEIYLILDLHAAPGGQSKDNIADYNPAYPCLWEDEVAKLRTVHLWKTLATRYANEEWIGGYDLINEPVYDFGAQGNLPLRDLYIQITNAIRSVDQNHLIFIEGNWYATSFGDLSPAWDDNMSYSFHKYWNNTDYGTIGYLVNLRNETNCPLWLGESGENSNQWFTDCIKLMESNNIGWAWWTLKKVEGNNSLMYVNKPAEYDYLLKYWSGTATKPSVDYAVNALNKFAESLKIENCKLNYGVVDAMFRQTTTTDVVPFAANYIPSRIYAVNYDYGQNNYAYKDTDFQNISNNAVWNSGYQYRNDGVDIEKCTDINTNGYNVGWINTGEFLNYTINVTTSGIYKLTFRVAGNSTGGKILMRLNGQNLGNLIDIPSTGGWTSWSNVVVNNIPLNYGIQNFNLMFFNGGFNLNYIDFELVTVGVDDENIGELKDFNLNQNYPNPFNPVTTLSFNSKEKGEAIIKIYNVTGELVKTLDFGSIEAGYNEKIVDLSNYSSGIYFYNLNINGKTQNYTATKKMCLTK
ncbi:MAG TPA: cellulase family glycosylhydrolase [Melioribacteraceae bacterium]|nr:cellulase family glycosylhydrolase [Melioribacteraceae bacterium]